MREFKNNLHDLAQLLKRRNSSDFVLAFFIRKYISSVEAHRGTSRYDAEIESIEITLRQIRELEAEGK
jgi:hypothetical protein